ncbi:alxA, partial [Symbiodinium sp. KB8]
MIRVPFKTTRSGTFDRTVRSFITKAFSSVRPAFLRHHASAEEATKQESSIAELHSLRHSVSQVAEPNDASLTALVQYYAVAGTLQVKLPVSVSAVKESFTWGDSLVPSKTLSHTSWAWERANVAFNIGAWHSQAALVLDRHTEEGVKGAAKRFLQAAHAFAFVRDELAPHLLGNLPNDLQPAGLSMLVDCMLAQAQVCYFERTGMTSSSPAVRARLAMHAA